MQFERTEGGAVEVDLEEEATAGEATAVVGSVGVEMAVAAMEAAAMEAVARAEAATEGAPKGIEGCIR